MPRNQEELELRKTVISDEIKKARQCRICTPKFDIWRKNAQSEFRIPRGEHPIKIDYTETIPAKIGVVLNAIDIKENEKLVVFNPIGIAHPRSSAIFSIDPPKRESSEYWNSGEVIEAYKEIRAKKTHTTIYDLWEFLYGKKLRYNIKNRFIIRTYDHHFDEWITIPSFSYVITFA